MNFKLNKKALAMKEVVIGILVLIILGVILYIAFGPMLMKAVNELFNKTGGTAEKIMEKGIGDTILKFFIK